MLLDKAVAQRVSDNILSLYDWILAVNNGYERKYSYS